MERSPTKPWKLRVDWLLYHAYGDPVVVELHIMGSPGKVIRSAPTVYEAVELAKRFMSERGFGWWVNLSLHEREVHKHITMHPAPDRGFS